MLHEVRECETKEEIDEVIRYYKFLIDDKKERLAKAFDRLRKVSDALDKMKAQESEQEYLTAQKEEKILTIIDAKNEMEEEFKTLRDNDLFIQKGKLSLTSLGEGYAPIKLSRSKVREISNLAHSINYLSTPFSKVLIHQLPWNSSILHQGGKRRVAKPECIHPARNSNLIGEGHSIVLHCSEPDSYIVFTVDGSIP